MAFETLTTSVAAPVAFFVLASLLWILFGSGDLKGSGDLALPVAPGNEDLDVSFESRPLIDCEGNPLLFKPILGALLFSGETPPSF